MTLTFPGMAGTAGSLLHTHSPGLSPGFRFANLNHLYPLPLPHPNLKVLLPLPPCVSLMYLLPIFQRSHLWDLNCHGSFVTGPPTSRPSSFHLPFPVLQVQIISFPASTFSCSHGLIYSYLNLIYLRTNFDQNLLLSVTNLPFQV